ncbi:unnamed protein product, partial [Tuber aestivum]
DFTELVSKLRAAIYNGISSSGLDLYHLGGRVSNMRELGVFKRAIVSSTSEATEMLLRVDSIIRAKPRT